MIGRVDKRCYLLEMLGLERIQERQDSKNQVVRSRSRPSLHRVLAILFVLIFWTVGAQPTPSVSARQEAIEQGLLPAVIVEGHGAPSYSLAERMEFYKVPGVSIAVIRDGHVEWAAAYGFKRAGNTEPVTVSTLFQAASISKPVTALAALRLVEEGRLNLDEDVNKQLRSWQVPDSDKRLEQAVTLRRLLSHSAGINVGGFPGYGPAESAPSVKGVLQGLGNTDAIQVDTVPGSVFRYSGGGYTIVQLLIEEVSGQPFSEVMERLVLRPLGMYRSTFIQPLPERLTDEAAVAHQRNGAPIKGGWHFYPEQAAAGLWTTPSDIARFALAVRAAYLGLPASVLRQATAQEMLTAQKENYGLGPGLGGAGDDLLFAHPGGNAGFRAFFVMYPVKGSGVVVMSNSDGGGDLNMEIVRAAARTYGWPDFKPAVRSTVRVDPAELKRLAGRYRFPEQPDQVTIVEEESANLYLTLPGELGGQRLQLFAISPTEFFMEATGASAVFEPEGRKGELEIFGRAARRFE